MAGPSAAVADVMPSQPMQHTEASEAAASGGSLKAEVAAKLVEAYVEHAAEHAVHAVPAELAEPSNALFDESPAAAQEPDQDPGMASVPGTA